MDSHSKRHDTELEPPFEAYAGDKPFMFVSYRHTDSAEVYPELTRLHDLGYRIWYDEGIKPTSDWPEEIADAITRCGLFVVFLSTAAVKSKNVLNEMRFALKQDRDILPIHLADTDMPKWWELQAGHVQAIPKWKIGESRYHRLLTLALADFGHLCGDLPRRPAAIALGLGPPQPQEVDPAAAPAPPPVETDPAAKTSPASRVWQPRRRAATIGPDQSSLVWVPPGSFEMGTDDISDDERPVHRVSITEGFWLGRCQVTNAQYRQFCSKASREFPHGSSQPDDHPVVCVNWDDACAYCAYYRLRLPTEAEWEWAARGEQGNAYPWGNEWDASKCGNADNKGPRGRTFGVGHFGKAGESWCGAQDMAGNVWEWCQDRYGPYSEQAASDPKGPDVGDARVLRGGGWYCDEANCRSADRYRSGPGYFDDLFGFRVALSKTP